MANSFLLRFQEQCEESCSGEVTTGTMTHTKMMREQADSDPSHLACKSLFAGTSTCTRVPSEQGDTDYANPARTLPIAPSMGTMTKTAVKMESDDQDRGKQEMAVFPKCSSL